MIDPSPTILMTMVVAQRGANFHAWADNDWLCELAQQGAARRQTQPDLAAVVAIVMALARLLVASSAEAEGDVLTGVNILRRALEEPLRGIVSTAGKDGAVIVEMVRRAQQEQNNPQVGYDVLAEQYVDMVEAGIVDPAKVTRSAVENAASIAGMILTTEALITDKPEKAAPAMPGGPGGMGDMVY